VNQQQQPGFHLHLSLPSCRHRRTTTKLSVLFLVKLLLIFKTTIFVFNSAKKIPKIIAEAFKDTLCNQLH
jgi:hypothetical protein